VTQALVRLSTLHALFLLESASGDLLASGFLSPAQAPLPQEALLGLLPAVRREAVSLMEAWSIPDGALASAIGASHGDYVTALRDFARQEPLNDSDVSPAFLASLAPLKEAARARL